MRTYKNLYKRLLSKETRSPAVHEVWNKRKKDRYILNNNYTETDLYNLSYDWLVDFKNDEHTIKIVKEGPSKKEREIIRPTVKELVVQHCLMNILKPIIIKGMYEHSYASIPDRGIHKGKSVIEKWIKRTNVSTNNSRRDMKYVLKMDIKKYFNTIRHDILMEKFRKYIKDEQILSIIQEIINVQPNGIPLGFYTSQWFANWYLQDLDHYIKEELCVKYYIRYMDDMVCFGSNKAKLHKVRKKIQDYLNNNLGLEMKDNWQLYLFDYVDKNGFHHGRDLDFMGFRFFRDRTIIRKSILFRIRQKAIKISKKDKPSIYDCKQMLSYYGWLKHSDSYMYYLKYIQPIINFDELKRRVSEYDRCKAKEESLC